MRIVRDDPLNYRVFDRGNGLEIGRVVNACSRYDALEAFVQSLHANGFSIDAGKLLVLREVHMIDGVVQPDCCHDTEWIGGGRCGICGLLSGG